MIQKLEHNRESTIERRQRSRLRDQINKIKDQVLVKSQVCNLLQPKEWERKQRREELEKSFKQNRADEKEEEDKKEQEKIRVERQSKYKSLIEKIKIERIEDHREREYKKFFGHLHSNNKSVAYNEVNAALQ